MNPEKFAEVLARIKKFNVDRNWAQFHDPKNLALSLQLEASEVLELFQWTKDNQAKPGTEQDMADELADVFYWVIMLGEYYNIDLLEALDRKMDKFTLPQRNSSKTT
jgi:NTP pyrophosphatase (non-canonical NTP hydrolase)